jgi:hypothetical protein
MKIYIYSAPNYIKSILKKEYNNAGHEVTFSDVMFHAVQEDYDILLSFDYTSTLDLDIRTIVYDWDGHLYSLDEYRAKELSEQYDFEIYGPVFTGKYVRPLFNPYRYWNTPRPYRPMVKPAGVAWFEQRNEWRKYFDIWEQCDYVFLYSPLRVAGLTMTSNAPVFNFQPSNIFVRKVLAYQTKIGVISTLGYIGNWFNWIFEGSGLVYLDTPLAIDYPASNRFAKLEDIKNMNHSDFIQLWHECHEWTKETMSFKHWLRILE